MNLKRVVSTAAVTVVASTIALAVGASPASAATASVCGNSALINASNRIHTTLKNPNNNIRTGPSTSCSGFGKPSGTKVTVYCYLVNPGTPGSPAADWYWVAGDTSSFQGWTIYSNLNGVNNTAC